MAAVTAGLAASLGAGYTAAKATLDDASTYVAKGDAVSHVNGESRQTDATSSGGLAKNLEDVDVTPLPNGKVAAVNRQTHKVTIMDGATLEQRTAEKGRAAGGAATVAPAVVVSGQVGWLLDYSSRSVRQVGSGDGKRIRLDGQPVDGAPGRNGSLIVLTEAGRLYEVSTQGKVRDIDWPDARNAALTVAGGHSYLVQAGGDIVEVDSGTPVKTANVEGVIGIRGGRMLVNSPQSAGKNVLIVQATQVLVVDPVSGDYYRIRHRATTTDFGEPVEYRNRIYLPNYHDHNVIVLDEKTQLPLAKPIPVPGTRGTFAVTVDGGRLWANDQYSNRMVEIGVDGVDHQIDKGKGNGVRGDQPKPPKTPTGTGATPPPASTPTTNPTRPNTPTQPTRPNPPSAPTSTPKKTVKVPDGLVGTNYSDACAKIEQLRLICQPISAGDEDGESDDVIDVDPGSGSMVEEGKTVTIRYYGPTTVPPINNASITPAAQCEAIEKANLKCEVQPAAEPATSLAQFGFVKDSRPAPGERVKTGDTVTVKYYASFPMPQYSNTNPGTPGVSTCQALSAKTVQLPGGQTKALKCTPTEGTKDNNAAANAGAVYEQTPPAGQPVSVDKPITLTYYAGEHKVDDYANANGGDAGAAQADCRKWFTGCNLKKGTAPIGHAQDVNKVEKTEPGAGTSVKVGDNVDIVVWDDKVEVPAVTGKSIGDACRDIEARGLVCDKDSNHPYSKQVGTAAPNGYPVSPGEGTRVDLGTKIVVPNATLQPVNIFKYRSKADRDVWVMRVEGNVPEGYEPGGEQVTTGYRDGQIQGGNTVLGYFCTECKGHSPNHYVSIDTDHDADTWKGGGSTGVQLLPASGGGSSCNQPGTAPIWRVSYNGPKGTGETRYDMQSSLTRPSSDFTEFLGCGLG